ncbi:MAG: LytTR family DNA-binding domain-containing protein, partial [Roseiarcus sp.]
ASHFCSLSIGEVEQRLDPRLFARVHRSHIVNIARVDGARFNGDSGVIELSGQERYSVPVSRGRIGQIKARLSGLESAAQ